jgi:hypothetical protein
MGDIVLRKGSKKRKLKRRWGMMKKIYFKPNGFLSPLRFTQTDGLLRLRKTASHLWKDGTSPQPTARPT